MRVDHPSGGGAGGGAGCGTFGYYLKNIIKFLLSHIGLVSLVVGYTIIGAITFEKLEAEEELKIKKNATATRNQVTDDLWALTEESLFFKEHEWTEKVRARLQRFEKDLIKSIKSEGWDGNEDLTTQQWTFSGALFYSIILITTIGYGHIAPKTTWGKVVTIFYAIPGVPLMMLCLANIGDGMAQSFRFLYWKICCYVCTKRPKRKRRNKSRPTRSRYPSSRPSSSGRARPASFRRSARISQRSTDSRLSDSAFYSNYDQDYRLNEDHTGSAGDIRGPPGGGRIKGRDEEGRDSGRSAREGSDHSPSNTRTSPHSSKTAKNHLEIPGEDLHDGEGQSSVLFNKYALEKEAIDVEAPSVHPSRGHSPRDVEPIHNFKQEERSRSHSERGRERDNRVGEPEILVTRAAKSAPSSLRNAHKTGYPDSPLASQRDPGYFARHLPHSHVDPRSHLSRMEEPYYHHDSYYDDEEGDRDEDVEEDDDEEEDDEIDETEDKPVPIWLGVMLVVVYIFGGASIFQKREGWEFLESVYFCFITLTTIGFGDYVPAQKEKENAELSIALCSIYLLFGIALLAMSFNLVQEEVISHVKRVAKRLGIIKEEGEEEE